MNAKLLFVHALSSLHPGTGQGAGVIDLPVAREVGTGLPYLPGSSLKGVLRDRSGGDPLSDKLFGPKTADITDANAYAGAAIFSDQRLLLLPVRSLAGTMAWVTCPFVLQRFRRDCIHLGLMPPQATFAFPDGTAGKKTAHVAGGSALIIHQGNSFTVALEDLDLTAQRHNDGTGAAAWAAWLGQRIFAGDEVWQASLKNRFCVVHDDVFSFLLETATEVIARNVLDEKNKTAKNLWYEEALPAETVLAGLVFGQQVSSNGLTPARVLEEVGKLVGQGPAQLGGHATVGRGLCRVVMEA